MGYFTVNEQYAFGVDLSKHNTSADGKKKIDFDLMSSHEPKVVFAGLRAGISWGYQDTWYNYYSQECKRVGILRMPYHVLYPGEPAMTQMDNFCRIVGDDLPDVRLVMDLELAHSSNVLEITKRVSDCLTILKKRTGRYPIIYSRATWVNEHLAVQDLPKLDWWLANYLWARPYPLYTPEYKCPPAMPVGVDNWLIHQTAEKAPSIGAAGNHYMDYNRWNGTEADVLEYFGVQDTVPEPPEELTLPQQVADHEIRLKALEAG